MLQNLIELNKFFSNISSTSRIKKANKAKFLTELRTINITNTINSCEPKNLRETVIGIYNKLRIWQDLKLPHNISRKIDAIIDSITELQQVAPNTKDETIAIHKAVVALCNLDKLLG